MEIFGIHILGFHGEILPFREEVSYGYEKIFIFLAGKGGIGVIAVPLVDQALQDISFFEEGGVDRGQVGHNSSQGPAKTIPDQLRCRVQFRSRPGRKGPDGSLDRLC